MLKLWQGKDGGSIIVSKSDPQHEMMQQLGFRMLVEFKYGSMNRIGPGDYSIYRAADYLGSDSIYRCMRINDGTEETYMRLKKDRVSLIKTRYMNKIIMSSDSVLVMSEEDLQYLACTSCKRIFRNGNLSKHTYTITLGPSVDIPTAIEWKFRNITCCDKQYAIGNNPNKAGDVFAFRVNNKVFTWSWSPGKLQDDEQLIVDYLLGRKEAVRVERDGK